MKFIWGLAPGVCESSLSDFAVHWSWRIVFKVTGILWYIMLCHDTVQSCGILGCAMTKHRLQLSDCYLLLDTTHACMVKKFIDISAKFTFWLLPGEEEETGIRLDKGQAITHIHIQLFILCIYTYTFVCVHMCVFHYIIYMNDSRHK